MDTRPVVQQPITLPLTGFLVSSHCTATSPPSAMTVEESGPQFTWLIEHMCNALAEPSCQAFLGQSFTGHTPPPKAHKQLFSAPNDSREPYITCQRTYRAEEVQFSLPVPNIGWKIKAAQLYSP